MRIRAFCSSLLLSFAISSIAQTASSSPASSSQSSKADPQLRSDRDRQDRRSLRRLLPVLLRQLDEEQSHPAGQVALGPLQRAGGTQPLRPARHSRAGAERRDSTPPSRRRSATTTPPAWTRATIEKRGTEPLTPTMNADRRDQDQAGTHQAGRRACSATASPALFSFGQMPDMHDSRQTIANHRSGRPDAARSRLLPQGRRQVGRDAAEVPGARAEDVRAGRRQARGRRRRSQDRARGRDRTGQGLHGPHRPPRSQEPRPHDAGDRGRSPGAQLRADRILRRERARPSSPA